MTQEDRIGFVNTLGYQSSVLDPPWPPQVERPTFPPSYNDFQPYQWQDGSGKPVPGSDNNCLLYTQMTQKNPPPATLQYKYTGNMIDSSESGTLIVSSNLFWKWLLPKLSTVNFNAYVEAKKAACDNNEISPNWHYEWAIGAAASDGRAGDQDPFYAWTSTGSASAGSYGFQWNPPSADCVDNEGSWLASLQCEMTSEALSSGVTLAEYMC